MSTPVRDKPKVKQWLNAVKGEDCGIHGWFPYREGSFCCAGLLQGVNTNAALAKKGKLLLKNGISLKLLPSGGLKIRITWTLLSF